MARPNQEAVETFISITGATEAVAEQKLLEHGRDLNEAVNAHFSEGDRNTLANVHAPSVATAQNDFMDVDDPVEVEPCGPPASHLSAPGIPNPFSLLDPSFRRSLFDVGSDFTNSEPFVTHPREVRQIPIEVRDGNQLPGHSGVAPVIEDVSETVHAHCPDIHGTIIIDDDDEVSPAVSAAQAGQLGDSVSHDGSRDQYGGPTAPRSDDLQDFGNEIEEQMIRAAIEASKCEVAENFPNQPLGVESEDVNNLGPVQRQPRLEDAELAHAVSLSLKTAEQEKALREQERNIGESSRGASNREKVELGNVAATSGRLEAGRSFVQDEVEDLDEQPLVRHRSRRMSSGSVESAKAVEVIDDSPQLSPRLPNRSISLERNGNAFHSEDWGGLSSLEHDEAVMLEAAMFGGIQEGAGYRFPYAPHQLIQPERPYPRPMPRPPSPSLTAQRLIREQQDDEYLASLQADRDKEQRAREEAEARLEEERRKEEESHKKLEEEKELERRLEAKEASLPQEPASDDEKAVTLLVRMPDGSRRGRRFLKSDKLQVRPYPRCAFEDGESALTLNELGLTSKQEDKGMATKKNKNEDEEEDKGRFWTWLIASLAFRLILIFFPNNLNLSSRPEVSTPLTSLCRLAEGYWLKQSSLSPYAGSMYHGSPLLLYVLGPLTVKRVGQPNHILCSLVFVIADVVNALLIRSIGKNLRISYNQRLRSLGFDAISKGSAFFRSQDIAALIYLWNPFTIVACVGFSTSPIENMAVILSLYGACTRKVPLAAFGWIMASHLSLYPVTLVIPVILLLGYGPETPPRKLFMQRRDNKIVDDPSSDKSHKALKQEPKPVFSWKLTIQFLAWSIIWSVYVLVLCALCVKQYGGLREMFKRTYGFILTVPDLSPNIGVLWYFFAEVFEFFRNFFLIVFHVNILFMIIPLAIRLNHRPCFLAFVYIAISSMLKSYPSVGDSALYLGLFGLFVNELADMQFSFFLFCGYVGVSLLSPVMHNLWIWRGTGNANFYFATAMAYACFQIVLVVESVSAMLNHDRKLTKLSTLELRDSKS